jgi:xylono-1,5-lactonase
MGMAMTVDTTAMTETRMALALEAQLGEGLHWDANTQHLWGVDIHGMHLWCWDLTSTAPQTWQLAQRVCWVLPTVQADKLLLGLQGGFTLADSADPTRFEWLHQPFLDNPALRLNDAKADATGAVWAGSLNNEDESQAQGCLYRLGPAGDLAVVDTGYTVANGPAINADSTLMLHTDSSRRTIYAFDLDAPAGKLANKRVWKVFAEVEGYPDGMCFDAEGCVWVAHWGAGCISRFAPSGQLLRRIAIPATNVTNVCFAGPRLDRLFVTTARMGLSDAALQLQPNAGGLFEVLAPGEKGLAGLPFRLGQA